MIPTQKRYVDPYQDIKSEDVDERLTAVYPSGKAIIYGCLLEISGDSTTITLQSGIVISDYVTIEIKEAVSFSASALEDNDYYVIGSYDYDIVSPPPEMEIKLSDSYTEDDIVFGKVTVQNHKFTNIDYSDRTGNDIRDKLIEYMANDLDADLNMNHHRIFNLYDCSNGDCNDDTAVNKKYIDNQINNLAKVKVDESDSSSDYLDNKIQVSGLQKQIQNSEGIHILNISDSGEVQVISGDSQFGYLNDKIDVQNPLDKSVEEGSLGKEIDISLLYDGLATDITTHGGLPSLETGTFKIDGEFKTALYVKDIFMHKNGNITEEIDGNKHFTGIVTIDNLQDTNGNQFALQDLSNVSTYSVESKIPAEVVSKNITMTMLINGSL